MGTTRDANITSTASRNIMLAIVEQNTTRNAVAVKAGIASTTFDRKLNHPGKFTLEEFGDIAAALHMPFVDLLRESE